MRLVVLLRTQSGCARRIRTSIGSGPTIHASPCAVEDGPYAERALSASQLGGNGRREAPVARFVRPVDETLHPRHATRRPVVSERAQRLARGDSVASFEGAHGASALQDRQTAPFRIPRSALLLDRCYAPPPVVRARGGS
jgi:hypothetical protein